VLTSTHPAHLSHPIHRLDSCPGLYKEVAAAVQCRLPDFTPQNLANAAWSSAKLVEKANDQVCHGCRKGHLEWLSCSPAAGSTRTRCLASFIFCGWACLGRRGHPCPKSTPEMNQSRSRILHLGLFNPSHAMKIESAVKSGSHDPCRLKRLSLT